MDTTTLLQRFSAVLLLLFLFTAPPLLAQSAVTITVRLTNAEYGADIVAMPVVFSDETNRLTATCTTNDAGECRLYLSDIPTRDTVRGKLDFGAFGVRSLIFRWQDGDFTVDLQTDHTGQIIVPGHPAHPTLPAASNNAPTALPPARPQTTLTPRPTSEFVVFDPYKYTPEPTTIQPPDLVVATITTPSLTTVEGLDSAETAPPSRWPLLLCSGLFITIWVAIIVSVRQRNSQPEEHFYV